MLNPTTIRIEQKTKEFLETLKLTKSETYNEILLRIKQEMEDGRE
jgi:hypothetical protein